MVTVQGYYFDENGRKVIHFSHRSLSNAIRFISEFAKRGGIAWIV